jgi:hypothetical protein
MMMSPSRVCLHNPFFVSCISVSCVVKVKSNDKTKQNSMLGMLYVDTDSGMTKDRPEEIVTRRPS